MKINDFKLECHFGKYEFTAPYLLTQSDCEAMTIEELLALEPGAEEGLRRQWLGYTETWGDPELRQQVAALYKTMQADNVLLLHGAQEGIFALMNVLLDEGDHMVAMFPNYQSAYEVANSVPRCECSPWMLREADGRWALDFDELESLIRPSTKLVAICSPNNPTGYTLTNAEIGQLVGICRQHGLYLFSDEVYKGLELDGERRDWVADHYERAISIGVMSKSYGLAGLRVGWMVSHDRELLDRCVRFKHYLSICCSAPSEYLAKLALRHGEQLLERSRNIIRDNKAVANAFFSRHPDLFRPLEFRAGPVAFHRWTGPGTADEFCRRAVEEAGVLLLPAAIYDMPSAPYFRMGYGRCAVPEAIAQLERFIGEAYR